MQNTRRLTQLHLWFPNLFEFKGGIQVYLQDLLRAIDTNFSNRYVAVFDKLDKAKPPDKFNSDKILFCFSGSAPRIWRTAHFSLNLMMGALLNRPSLILCGHLNFSPVALWIYRLTHIPYWIIVYGVDAWEIQNQWKTKALHAAEKIISISGYTRDRLIQEQNLPSDKFSLLPVTFDASRFNIGPKPDYLLKRYGLQPEQTVILTVTRLSSADGYKGYDQIIQSLPKIRRQIPNVHYVIAGTGDDRSRIEQLINQLHLQECVTLTGFIPDNELNDHYNLCDVFAMPSKGEGFGIVYLEALACGKPTLGGNQDGALDALCHGELGVLVNPDDVSAIAQKLTQILQGVYPHPILYQPETLRQKVIGKFGFEQFRQTLADLLRNANLGVDERENLTCHPLP